MRLTHLEFLALTGKFISLPPNFTKLTKLKHLELSENADLLNRIAPLQQMTGLENITLIFSKAINTRVSREGAKLQFPAFLYHLPVVKMHFYVSNPLPDDIGRLQQLKALYLELCKVDELPPSLFDITGLDTLELRFRNRLRSIPEDLGKLKNLRSLVISYYTRLTTLPRSIGNLKQLKELEICDCRKVASLPPSIAELKDSLTYLKFKSLPLIHELPQWIGQMKSLKSIFVAETPNLTVPDSLLELEDNLKSVSFDDCENLQISDDVMEMCNMINEATEVGLVMMEYGML